MSTVTLRIPDDKHERLRALARSQRVSVNRLLDELATVALAEQDAYSRYKVRAARGKVKEGLRLLDKLDRRLAR